MHGVTRLRILNAEAAGQQVKKDLAVVERDRTLPRIPPVCSWSREPRRTRPLEWEELKQILAEHWAKNGIPSR